MRGIIKEKLNLLHEKLEMFYSNLSMSIQNLDYLRFKEMIDSLILGISV